MTWDQYCLMILRALIDDEEVPYTYSDERLIKLLCSAAVFVQVENKLENQYVVNMSTYTITPDPVQNDDMYFVALMIYKAACMLAQTKSMKQGSDGMRVKDDLTEVETKGRNSANTQAVNNFCDMYNQIRWEGALNGNDGVNRYGIIMNTYGGNYDAPTNFR